MIAKVSNRVKLTISKSFRNSLSAEATCLILRTDYMLSGQCLHSTGLDNYLPDELVQGCALIYLMLADAYLRLVSKTSWSWKPPANWDRVCETCIYMCKTLITIDSSTCYCSFHQIWFARHSYKTAYGWICPCRAQLRRRSGTCKERGRCYSSKKLHRSFRYRRTKASAIHDGL